jgi:hypothetical protein
MAWLKLEDVNGFPVYVNTDLITHIQPYPEANSKTSVIFLATASKDGGSVKVPVKHTPDEVLMMKSLRVGFGP